MDDVATHALPDLPGRLVVAGGELDGIELFDPKSPIKYIVTVEALKELADTEASLEKTIERWMELEEMQGGG